MSNPTLTIYSGQTIIASNDDWGGGAQLTAAFAAVGLSPLLSNSHDAALLLTLPSGAYTAVIKGATGEGSEVVAEVYFVN